MTIEDALFGFLSSQQAIAAVLGNPVRLYYRRSPDTTVFPAATFKKITGRREVTHSGKAGLAQRHFQISVRSGNAKEANDIADLIADTLDGYSGPMGGAQGLPKVDCEVDNEIDFEEPETRLHHAAVDVLLWYRRS